MYKKRNSDVYIAGDSMLNGLDERKMKKGNGNPGATVTDMLDYLKPISRKQPSHLIEPLRKNLEIVSLCKILQFLLPNFD